MLSPNSPFYCSHCIACRLPSARCVCDQIERHDNTGQWAFLSSNDIHRIRWHRKPELIYPKFSATEFSATEFSTNSDEQAGHYLLFPSDDAANLKQVIFDATVDAHPIKALWIIDGTWQEAKKMLRQSPWLKALPKVSIQETEGEALESHFKLRKNQQGLCTFEAIQAAIKFQDPLTAQSLNTNFHLFQNTLLGLLR